MLLRRPEPGGRAGDVQGAQQACQGAGQRCRRLKQAALGAMQHQEFRRFMLLQQVNLSIALNASISEIDMNIAGSEDVPMGRPLLLSRLQVGEEQIKLGPASQSRLSQHASQTCTAPLTPRS